MDSSNMQNDNNSPSAPKPQNCLVKFVCDNRNFLILALVVVAVCVMFCDFDNNNKTFDLSGGASNTRPLLTNFLNNLSSQSEFQFSL